MPSVLAALRHVHAWGAWVVIVGNGLAGLWALAAHRITDVRTPAVWWFTGLVQSAVLVEVAVGVAMHTGQDVGVDRFHTFYGFLAVFAVAIIYSYRQQVGGRLYLLYGFGGLFVMGLGIRALTVGV